MESSERVGTARGPLRPASLSHKSSLKPEDVHVLLVDDERLSRTIVSNLLRRCNYTGELACFDLVKFFMARGGLHLAGI